MPTLESALEKYDIPAAQRKHVMRLVKQYRDQDVPADEAIKKALADCMADANEQIKDVSKQINGQKGQRDELR